ncbi:MAG: polysaccharide biosynthesis/export family protein [Terriglobia bacterium]
MHHTTISSIRVLTMLGLVAGAALLAGCGASLNNDPAIGLTTSSVADPKAGAGLSDETARPSAARSAELAHAADKFTSMSKPGSAAYKIGPQDVLDISVFKVPDLTKTVQVADSGSINLPLVGEIPAAGRTAQDIERDLTKRLGAKYLQSPQVTVFVKEYNSQRVTVDGAVKKPGVYPIRGQTSLLQAVAMAEGQDSNRASSDVVVFREIKGTRSAARFDLDEIRAGRAKDPILQQGDVVVVDTSTAKLVLNVLLRAPLNAFVPLL